MFPLWSWSKAELCNVIFKNIYISAPATLSCDLFQTLLKAEVQFMMWLKDMLPIYKDLIDGVFSSELKINVAVSALPLVLIEKMELA